MLILGSARGIKKFLNFQVEGYKAGSYNGLESGVWGVYPIPIVPQDKETPSFHARGTQEIDPLSP